MAKARAAEARAAQVRAAEMRPAAARVAGARAAWRLAGLDDFRTAAAILGQTPKGRFDLPSVSAFAPKQAHEIVPRQPHFLTSRHLYILRKRSCCPPTRRTLRCRVL